MKLTPYKPEITLLESGLNGFDLSTAIKNIRAKSELREVKLTFAEKDKQFLFGRIEYIDNAVKFFKNLIGDDMLIQEVFCVLFLDARLNIIGYMKHSKGSTNQTLVDIKIIVAAACATLSNSVIVCHNHPSGNATPSDSDIATTKKIKDALKLVSIGLIDHQIVTENSYYSFKESGRLNGLSGAKKNSRKDNNYYSETSLTNLMGNRDKTQAIRTIVGEALSLVTKANSPYVWAKIQTKDGYQAIEQRIIEMILANAMQPEAIIPQIEQEYGE